MSERPDRILFADFDDEGIHVYQAFKPSIVEAALKHGTFRDGFNLDRMTWIKPSFGWMMYRSDYATARRQERILKIKLPHNVFTEILDQAVPTSFDRRIHVTKVEWQDALRKSEVRYQWDPDHDWRLLKLERRAIQLGLKGEVVKRYVSSIVGLEDVTFLAHACKDARAKNRPVDYPNEREYPISDKLKDSLGMNSYRL